MGQSCLGAKFFLEPKSFSTEIKNENHLRNEDNLKNEDDFNKFAYMQDNLHVAGIHMAPDI